MSTDDQIPPSKRIPEISAMHLRNYRRAACHPDIRAKVERLLDDLGRWDAPSGDKKPSMAVGTALAVAHAALELATMTATNNADRALQGHVLRGNILPVLEAVGYENVGALIKSALACDIEFSMVLQGSYARH